MINVYLALPLIAKLAEGAVDETLWQALILPLIVVAVLIIVNGIFVAAEFAILGARPTRMETLAADGNERAVHVLEILESNRKQNTYLATAQLGITVVTLGLAMYGEAKLAHWFEINVLAPLTGLEPDSTIVLIAGYVITLGVLTYLHVVVGEMVPKSIALSEPNKTALQLDRFMAGLRWVLFIPIWILNSIGDLLLRLFGIPLEAGTARLYSPEEIEQLVSESTEGGLITQEAEEIIGNILDFHDRDVGQIMTPRRKVDGIPVDIEWNELVKVVAESNHSRFPVYEDDLDHVVGILHLKDFIAHHRAGGEPVNLRDMLRPTPVVTEHDDVTDLLQAFKLQRIHMAIVLDEHGGVAGIVTLEDLVEEIVGEVRDEFDIEREPYVELEPGTLEASGDYLLDDLKEAIYIGEDEDLPDVDTVGGLIVTKLGRPPQSGDTVELDGSVVVKVLGVDGMAVTRVQIDYPSPEQVMSEEDSDKEKD